MAKTKKKTNRPAKSSYRKTQGQKKRSTPPKALRRNLPKQVSKQDRPSRKTQFRERYKRVFQLTEYDAKERITFKATKGRKPTSNTENAKRLLESASKKARKKFSRKHSGRYVARIKLKWKSESGKWVSRTLYRVSESMQEAIEDLLKEEEINSLTYEVMKKDKKTGKKKYRKKKIHSKEKKIVGVSFDKYVKRKVKHGKVSKTTSKKGTKKKSRGV